jgi:predicted nucleic acid-binding protein
MMIPSTTPIVLDSTVLIALSTVGQVDLLRWRVLIPEKVVEELSKEPARSTLVSLVKWGKAEVIKPPEELRKKALFILSDKEETGDSDVIATVLELKDVVIATDDRRLRKVCKILGAKVTGTIGIIVDAVLHGPLTEEEGKELLKKLDYSGFRMNVALYEKALALMGGVKFN